MKNQTLESESNFDSAFLNLLQQHRQGNVLNDLADAVRTLTEAVQMTGKPGHLLLKIIVTPAGAKGVATTIFANVTETSAAFCAVLDYHEPSPQGDGEPGFPHYCSHLARFTTIETPEWRAWKAVDRKPMSQVDFATWLEDNLSLFASPVGSGAPTGADLLELVRTLHGHKNARFNTALRLDNGAYTTNYDEDVEVKGTITTKGGSLQLPPTIVGGFAIFQGTPAYQVHARLKTRITDRKLTVYFETIAMTKIIRESLDMIVERVAEKTTLKPMLGAMS